MRSDPVGPGFAERFVDRFLGLETLTHRDGIPNEILDRLKSPEGATFVGGRIIGFS